MSVHHQNAGPRQSRGVRSSSSPAERQLASQIASLGNAIGPGTSHRRRVLEQASQSVGRQNGKMRTAQVVIGLSLVLVVVSPMIASLTRIEAPTPQTASRANAEALRKSEGNRLSFDWALVELFKQFREEKRFDR